MATDDPIQPQDPDRRPGPDDDGSRRSDRMDAVRRAVDQALTVTAGSTRTTRARAQELADDLTQVVTRVRGALEDLGSAGTSQAGALADEVQQAVGRLGRSLDDVRPATGDDVRRLATRLDEIDERLARLERSATGADGPGRGAGSTP